MNRNNDKYRRKTLADLLQRRGTATFDLLAEATQKLLLTSNNLIFMTTGEPRRKSVPPNEYRSIIIPGHHQCYYPARPLAAVGASNSGGALGGGAAAGPNTTGSCSGSNWLLTFADALDPSRDSTITAVYRLLRAKDRIGESYKKIKGAFKKLQDEYLTTKDDLNPILRYTSMKKMVKEIVALEKQYWILIDVPKQEPSESQMDFIVRILNCLDQRLQAASSTGAQQAKVTGIASLFAGSTQLSDRSKDALLLEQVKSKSTDELRKENSALQNEFYKLLKKYCGLKALATQMRIDFESTRLYPIIPRYSMLKHMIKSALRSPTFMEVCHEQDDF